MRGWPSRVAVFLLVLGSITASASTPPTVVSVTPGTDGNAIARFTLRFSEPMQSVGAKGGPPMTMTCPVGGAGRWVDPTTYVWEYDHALPGGLSCKAELKDDLKTLAGREVTGTRSFPIDTGGPFVRAILPTSGSESEIEEDQAFFVATNGPVDRASIAADAYCTVDGIGERIAVDLLPPETAENVLTKINRWERHNFLENAGQPGDLPDDAKARAETLSAIVALKCRRPLPPGRDMALVWAGAIHSPSGKLAGEDKRFDFTVRPEFNAKLTCSRVNPESGCDPVEAIKVEYQRAGTARAGIGGAPRHWRASALADRSGWA